MALCQVILHETKDFKECDIEIHRLKKFLFSSSQVVLREHVRAHHSGPDPKSVTSATPYVCKVCDESFDKAEDLVLHIVKHCDDNTARKRQPQTGPRKYKRRRKMKPNETNTMVRKNEFTYDMMEGSATGGNVGGVSAATGSDSEDNTKRKLGKKNKQQHRSNVEEGYQNVLKSFESSLQNINSIVSNSKLNTTKSKLSKKKLRKEEKKQEAQASPQSGRPKMIHTQKTRVPVEVGSDGAKKGQKTKTMVTRTPKVMPNEHKTGTFPGGERNRPRTKNVSYHVEGKQQIPPATFPTKVAKENTPSLHQQPKLVIIKQEPGTQKTDSHRNNNGNILALGEGQEPSPAKKKPAPKKSRRQRHVIVKQEANVVLEPTVEEQQQHMQLRNNNNKNNSGDTARLMEQAVDGSNMEVAFEASVITAQEEDQDDDEEEESILPHDVAAEDIGNRDNNVKLSVKVESASPARMLAVHSVITSVDDVPETIIPDAVEYTCEMCAAVFSSRAELLVHVPIHI